MCIYICMYKYLYIYVGMFKGIYVSLDAFLLLLSGSIEEALWDFYMSNKNGFKEYQSQLRSIK